MSKYMGTIWGPPWLMLMPDAQEKLRNNEIVAVAGGIYALCRDCGKVVKLNKFIFGALHICG